MIGLALLLGIAAVLVGARLTVKTKIESTEYWHR